MDKDWWEKVPQEVKEKIRNKLRRRDAVKVSRYKRKTKNWTLGEDVTGKELPVKLGEVPSGFVDEPDKYDDFAFAPADPVALGLVEDNGRADNG